MSSVEASRPYSLEDEEVEEDNAPAADVASIELGRLGPLREATSSPYWAAIEAWASDREAEAIAELVDKATTHEAFIAAQARARAARSLLELPIDIAAEVRRLSTILGGTDA